jgi:hypothetical protein
MLILRIRLTGPSAIFSITSVELFPENLAELQETFPACSENSCNTFACKKGKRRARIANTVFTLFTNKHEIHSLLSVACSVGRTTKQFPAHQKLKGGRVRVSIYVRAAA